MKLLGIRKEAVSFYKSCLLDALSLLKVTLIIGSTLMISSLYGQNPPGGCTYYEAPLYRYTTKVTQSSDDAYENLNDSGAMNLTDSNFKLGEEGTRDMIGGIRFQQVILPANAIIESAYMEFIGSYGSETGTLNTIITGENNTHNSLTFSFTAQDITNRTPTTNQVSWTIPSYTYGASNPNTISPDLTTILNEFIADGWTSGNPMTFLLTQNGTELRTFGSYEFHSSRGLGNGEFAPTLVINYSLPVPSCVGIAGYVYNDYNDNGLMDEDVTDICETGIGAVVVNIYNDTILVGTTTTDNYGNWNFPTATTGVPYRVEYIYPTQYEPAKASTLLSATETSFVTAPECCIDFGLHETTKFLCNDPQVLTVCNVKCDAAFSAIPVLISIKESQKGNSLTDITDYTDATHPVKIPASAIGSVWGVAYNKKADVIYAGAKWMNLTNIGPSGTGAIYCIDNSTNDGTDGSVGAAQVSTLASIANAGVDPAGGVVCGASNEPTFIQYADKIGLGDVDINDANDTLFTINLNTRQLVIIPIDGCTVTGTITTASLPIPSGTFTCSGDILRPYGLKYYNGKIYVGAVCTAETTKNASNLWAYVFSYTSGAGFNTTPVLDFPLDYTRKAHSHNTSNVYPHVPWFPWRDVWDSSNLIPDSMYKHDYTQLSYPQPVLSDIEFDKGDMILGFMDRFGNQFKDDGDPSGWTGSQNGGNNRIEAIPTGDLLRAGNNGNNTWTIENNAFVNGVSTGETRTTGINSQSGPSGGEYYFDDNYGNGHSEVTLGGLTQLPGRASVIAAAFDPTGIIYEAGDPARWGTGGLMWLENSTGQNVYGWEGYDDSGSFDFGKGNGFGDVEYICECPPIEIGNRIWLDTDGNGVQDPTEQPIEGVVLELYDDAGTVVGTTTTDANGRYFFNDSNVILNGATGLDTVADYTIAIATSNFNANKELEIGGENYGILSINDNSAIGATNHNDSDALDIANSGIASIDANDQPYIALRTGSFGVNDYSFDIGFRICQLDLSIAQTVCTDNGNGTFTAIYDVLLHWEGPPPTGDITLQHYGDGILTSTIVPRTTIDNRMDTTLSAALTIPADGYGSTQLVAFFDNEIICKDTLSFKAPLPCPTDVSNCSNATGCLGGNAFEDFNCNGTDDTYEPGVQGVQVVIYDCDNNAVDTVWTDSDGDWQLCSLTDGEAYRVEFILPESIACWASPTHSGSDNGTDVQFLTAPACTQFSLSNPSDYCQSNPDLIVPCYVSGDPLAGGTTAPDEALVALNYDGTTKRVLARMDSIGAVWGVAQKGKENKVYTSAVLKRHVGYGPLGPGGIYCTDLSTDNTSRYFDVEALGIDVGINPRNSADPANNLPADKDQPSQDSLAFHLIGYNGIGDLDFSDDGNTLWLTNLKDGNIYSVDVSNGMPTSNEVSSCTLPNPCGTSGNAVPWALKYYKGAVYVGMVCNAENSQDRADLSATVYKIDPNSCGSKEIISFPLDFTKGFASGYDTISNRWYPWVTEWSQLPGAIASDGTPRPALKIYPQPILSDIEFDDEGAMILGFVDRTGFQVGQLNMNTDGSMDNGQDFGGFSTMVGGDILRVHIDNNCQGILENNGTAGNHTTSGANNGQGPGGGEFYTGDTYSAHQETSLGGLAVVMGMNELVVTTYDPLSFDAAGLEWLDNDTGTSNLGYTLYSTTGGSGTFAKGVGLGDVEAICTDCAPLEIGNLVWCDSIQNGIQDACEKGVDSMIVRLYAANGTLVGQDTTLNSGQYYFNQYNVDTTGITVDVNGVATPANAWTGMSYSTKYYIVFGYSQYDMLSGSFTIGTTNYGGFTTADVNTNTSDNIDSDVVDATFLAAVGSKPRFFPSICMTTDATGCGNHRYDLGIVCTVDSSDYADACIIDPCHIINPAIYLGDTITPDATVIANAMATGDTDEGVHIPASLDVIPGGTINLPVTMYNTTGSTAYLHVWIDWNGDGDFDGTDEFISTTSYPSGTYSGSFIDTLTITVPDNALEQAIGMRWRFTTDTSGNATTPCGTGTCAMDGEVEDYLLEVQCKVDICLPATFTIRRGRRN